MSFPPNGFQKAHVPFVGLSAARSVLAARNNIRLRFIRFAPLSQERREQYLAKQTSMPNHCGL
jgi:hypothetical protein